MRIVWFSPIKISIDMEEADSVRVLDTHLDGASPKFHKSSKILGTIIGTNDLFSSIAIHLVSGRENGRVWIRKITVRAAAPNQSLPAGHIFMVNGK